MLSLKSGAVVIALRPRYANGMLRQTVLIVEDEIGIAESLDFLLAREALALCAVTTLTAAREALAAQCPALLLLDLTLPDGNGLEFLRELRAARSTVPVIVLTSRNDEIDRVLGLELGADDYVVKPFSVRELVARIKAVLRRKPQAHGADDAAELPLNLDLGKRRVTVMGREVPLTKLEFELLALLMQRPGQVFERETILTRVWGDAVVVEDRTVDAHIKSLRKKLEEAGGDPSCVETVRGVGYRLRE